MTYVSGNFAKIIVTNILIIPYNINERKYTLLKCTLKIQLLSIFFLFFYVNFTKKL